MTDTGCAGRAPLWRSGCPPWDGRREGTAGGSSQRQAGHGPGAGAAAARTRAARGAVPVPRGRARPALRTQRWRRTPVPVPGAPDPGACTERGAEPKAGAGPDEGKVHLQPRGGASRGWCLQGAWPRGGRGRSRGASTWVARPGRIPRLPPGAAPAPPGAPTPAAPSHSCTPTPGAPTPQRPCLGAGIGST